MCRFFLVLLTSLAAAGLSAGSADAQGPSPPRTDSAGDPLPRGPVARLGVTRFRHGLGDSGMTISPDSKTLVTIGDGGIRFWDIANGKLLHELRNSDKRSYSSGLYSPDGTSFVTTSSAADFRSKEPDELIFWDKAAAKPERTYSLGFKLSRESPGRFAFTPDSKFLIGSDQGHVVVIEAATGTELLRYRLGKRPLAALALSPDGRLVAAAAQYQGGVKLWQWESIEEPRLLKSGRDQGFDTLAFSPDGKLLFGRGRYSGDDGIAVWDVPSGKLLKDWTGHRSLDYADTFAIHPDGKLVATVQAGNRDGDDGPGIFLWNFATGKLERRLPSGGHPILFSPDRRWLAARAGGGARVWDLQTFQEVAVYEASHRGTIWRMEVSPQGVLATASYDETIGLWDARGRFLRKVATGVNHVNDLAFSGDGNRLLVLRYGHLDLWDVTSGRKHYTLPGHGHINRQAVRFSADASEFFSFGDDYFFRRYRTANGKVLVEKRLIPAGMDAKTIVADSEESRSILERANDLIGVKFTRDSKMLVMAERNRIHVFDTATATESRHFDTTDTLDWNGFVLSPDGQSLLATALDLSKVKENGQGERKPYIVIWDLANGKVLRRDPVPEQYGSRVAFSPDGKLFAILGSNYRGKRLQRVHIRECATGKEVHVIDTLPDAVYAVAFSRDGRRVYTSMEDTTVLVWQLPR